MSGAPQLAPTKLEPEIRAILAENAEISFVGVRRKLEERLKLAPFFLDSVKDELNFSIAAHLRSSGAQGAEGAASRSDGSESDGGAEGGDDGGESSGGEDGGGGRAARRAGGRPGQLSPSSTCPRWVSDRDRTHCSICSSAFTLLRRRHHCRLCGELVCHQCSPNKHQIASPFFFAAQDEPVRVCTPCFEQMVEVEAAEAPAEAADTAGGGAAKTVAAADAAAVAAVDAAGAVGGGGGGGGGEAAGAAATGATADGGAPSRWFLTGEWMPDEARSRTTLEPMMKALGVPWAARKIVNRMKFICEMRHSSTGLIVIDKTTMGEKTQSYNMDGKGHVKRDDKGGEVTVRCIPNADEQGSVTLETDLPNGLGTMIDRRWVEEGGAVLRRTLIVRKAGAPDAVCDRLMVRTEGSCGPAPRTAADDEGALEAAAAEGAQAAALERRRVKRRETRRKVVGSGGGGGMGGAGAGKHSGARSLAVRLRLHAWLGVGLLLAAALLRDYSQLELRSPAGELRASVGVGAVLGVMGATVLALGLASAGFSRAPKSKRA